MMPQTEDYWQSEKTTPTPTPSHSASNASSDETRQGTIDLPKLDHLTLSPSRPAERPVAEMVQDSTGAMLTGKQEHYLKRELIAQQVNYEITDLASPTALQRFGAPFRSDRGEVLPQDSEFPLLRYLFVNHVRQFPFLDQAKEKEFWQDKLQIFLEIFARTNISCSEDRLEETKRRKIATKTKKAVELIMVSGIPTASGYEERIKFSEMEVIDRDADDSGLMANVPEGNAINSWDVNVAGVRTISPQRFSNRQHAMFILRVRKSDSNDIWIGRRYGDFWRLHRRLQTELPGLVLPPLPKKNKTDVTALVAVGGANDSASISSVSTSVRASSESHRLSTMKSAFRKHRRSPSVGSTESGMGHLTPTESDGDEQPIKLFREEQRVSLRLYLRELLQQKRVAASEAMSDFLTCEPLPLNAEDKLDIEKRHEVDEKHMKARRQFYEQAQQRARELDVYMEQFRRDVVEGNGLSKLFAEIRQKEHLDQLSVEYKKFAEWVRIEVAAVIYHLFLADDNSADLFRQLKSLHSMFPYRSLRRMLKWTNPTLVMDAVLNLLFAQPFGARSMLQRMFEFAVGEGIKTYQEAITVLEKAISLPLYSEKLKNFCYASEEVKNKIRSEAAAQNSDILVAVLESDDVKPSLSTMELADISKAERAWNRAIETEESEQTSEAEIAKDAEDAESVEKFSQLKHLLKMYTRLRDKEMMLTVIGEPVTLQLFRDLYKIFYHPLVRIYKTANVYDSITDFRDFLNDTIKVIEKCRAQTVAPDPNQTVQTFIDLCARHESNLYDFIHEVHTHDDGLFDKIMSWTEGLLEFLRKGPKSGVKLNMNALFEEAVSSGAIDKTEAMKEIESLVAWQAERKRWHNVKTRRKMAAAEEEGDWPGAGTFRLGDFGLAPEDVDEFNALGDEEEAEEDEVEELLPLAAEKRRRRAVQQGQLQRSAGEPAKPPIKELVHARDLFAAYLRKVLAG